MNGVPLEQTTTIYQAIQQHFEASDSSRGSMGAAAAAAGMPSGLYRKLGGRIFSVSYREYTPQEDAPAAAPAFAGGSALVSSAGGRGVHALEAALVPPLDLTVIAPGAEVFTSIMLLRALHLLNDKVSVVVVTTLPFPFSVC